MTTGSHNAQRALGARRVIAEAHAERLLREFHHDELDSTGHDLRLLGRLWPYLRTNLRLLVPALLLIPITIYAETLQPLLTKQAIDGVLGGDRELWQQAMVMYAVVISIEFICRFVQVYCMQLAGQRAMAGLRSVVFDRAQRLHISFYDKTPVGRILTRVTNDVDSLGEIFSSGAVMAVADVLLLAAIVGRMLSLDLGLSLVTFAVLPLLAVTVEVIRRLARRAFREIRARVAQLNAYMSEQVQGMQVVQAYGREAISADEYRVINDAYRRANHSAIRYDAMLYSVVEAFSNVCIALVIWYAATRLMGVGTDSTQHIGTVIAFYQFIQKFFVPIRDLSTKYTIIQSALASAERIFEFLDRQDVEEASDDDDSQDGPVPDPRADPVVEFTNVHFGYRADEPVLRDLNLSIKPGEHVAIVGSTGAGKTSTIALLLRFYTHDRGTIRAGGHAIGELSLARLRGLFSVVSQDVFMFRGTVGQNLAMGAEVDERRALDALRRVGALEMLEGRGGLSATIDERGANFSAGQRQLLAFARALYRDAPILILDEATANIDSETEAVLQKAVGELIAGRTAIVIAHRLSTIRTADRIVVFHRGQIVEQGTHEDLLERGQVYAHLHRLQFAAPPSGNFTDQLP